MRNKKQPQAMTTTTRPFELGTDEHRRELALMLAFCTFHSDQIKNETAIKETQLLINVFIEQYFACIKENG